MNWIIPLGSSILGAAVGGVFLLGGQEWNNLRTCRGNSKIIFTSFLRDAVQINDNIIKQRFPPNSVVSLTIEVKTQVYYDHERFLIQCINPITLDKIYENIKNIEAKQNIIASSLIPPDKDVSYGMVCSIQKILIEILEQLKAYAYSKFHKKTCLDVDIVISNLSSSFQQFQESPSDFRRFYLVPSKRVIRVTQS